MRKNLYSFINSEFYSIFNPAFFGLSIMILSLRLVKIFESAQTNLSLKEFLTITTLLLPSIYHVILPISYLLAVTITLTKLSSTNELIALNNSRISSLRVLQILLIITIPIIFFNILNSLLIKPMSNKFLRELLTHRINEIIISPQKNVFTKISKGKYIFIEEAGQGIDSIVFADFKDDGFLTVSARSGSIDKGIFNFSNGNLIQVKGEKTEILDFDSLSLQITQDLEKKPEEFKRGSIPLRELINIYKEGANLEVIKTEIFYRIFYPLAPLILLFLAFPLSIGFSRHYKTQGIIISISIGLVFYLLFSFVDTISIKGKISPFAGFLLIYVFLFLLSYLIFLKKGLINKNL
ncbi:MAG: LptF/LptG family permease [Proteobacteria bacterium]|nr:LptF/LptG family permease [Pseudomonadota bacterium]